MNSPIASAVSSGAPQMTAVADHRPAPAQPQDQNLRKAFDAFVGEALFTQMLKGMRKTLGKPAYFHGGRAEEVFQQQLDQVLAEKLSQSSGDKLSGPMYELFTLGRR
jgi:Rod binding domain-containing protein